MALLRYAAKFDPFLSLDCAGLEGGGWGVANFAIWQPCLFCGPRIPLLARRRPLALPRGVLAAVPLADPGRVVPDRPDRVGRQRPLRGLK